MRSYILKLVLLAITVGSMAGCKKKLNDWDVDPSYQRLFRSLIFESSKIGATDVEIRYTQTVSADKYIFEFSKDSLQFGEVIRTVEILADTLIPFAPSTSPTRVEFRTTFQDLDGNSGYSVRMKGVNTVTGDESKYSEFFFHTTTEQLFSKSESFLNRIALYWQPTDRVSHISLFSGATGQEMQKFDLTASDKQAGRFEITDLDPGTSYRVAIYNGEVNRGSLTLKTSGLEGGTIIPVNPGDDIPGLVATAIAGGKSAIILMFSGGTTYELGVLTLPAGLSDISLTGDPDVNGNNPTLSIRELKITDLTYGKVLFENLNVTAASGSGHFINLGTNGLEFAEYTFINCYIANFGSSVVRLSNSSIKGGGIIFDKCRIHKIGGWGVVNIGGNNPVIDSISFTNSTLTDLATQLMDVRAEVGKIVIGNCTFYNQNAGMSQLLRFNSGTLPFSLVTFDNIFSGSNSGGKINAVSYDHANFGLSVSFAGSYRTNEMQIERASRDFANITIFNGSAAELFVNPDEEDFRIKTGNGFGGLGTAGDPRWFN